MIYFLLFCFVFNKMCLFLQKAYKQIDNYYINQIFSERMKKRFVLLLACLLAGIGLAIAQTPKTITGVVISEEDNRCRGIRTSKGHSYRNYYQCRRKVHDQQCTKFC